jgi:DnaJ-class molecular chaperone
MSESADSELIGAWLAALDESDYYQLLGLSPEDNSEKIQAAFHRFSQSFHPDRHRHREPKLRTAVTQIYRRGTEAYGVLRSATSRAAYDLALLQDIKRLHPARSPREGETSGGLASTCLTAGGQLHARQIERALSRGEYDEARRLVDKTRLAEGENPEFEGRVARLWGQKS